MLTAPATCPVHECGVWGVSQPLPCGTPPWGSTYTACRRVQLISIHRAPTVCGEPSRHRDRMNQLLLSCDPAGRKAGVNKSPWITAEMEPGSALPWPQEGRADARQLGLRAGAQRWLLTHWKGSSPRPRPCLCPPLSVVLGRQLSMWEAHDLIGREQTTELEQFWVLGAAESPTS